MGINITPRNNQFTAQKRNAQQMLSSRTTQWIAFLAVSVTASYFLLDPYCITVPLREWFPGDVNSLLENFGAFGHGTGCLIALLLIWNLDQQGRQRVKYVISAALLSGLIVTSLKVIVQRPRPFVSSLTDVHVPVAFDEALLNNSIQSFPSGHTATAFALAVTLSMLYPRGKRLFFGFAIITGLQRVVSRNHFPSDVFAGAIVGILSAQVACLIIKSFEPNVLSIPATAPTTQALDSLIEELQQCV